MPIPLPHLDDRRWADLVDEGRSLIPLYSQEWTNFNPSDPGITLMELFAWIAEMDIYQLNRIPDRHKRKFLELLGVKLTPPQPARTLLAFSLPSGRDPMSVPEGTQYQIGNAKLSFRTLGSLTVAPGRIVLAQMPDALYLGFSDPLPEGARISLYVEVGTGQRTARDVRWEYFNNQRWWSALKVQDATHGFTCDGVVSLTGPTKMREQTLGKVPDALYYVRARTSVGDAPVARSVTFNAVAAEQTDDMEAIKVGIGTGAPYQCVTLPDAPVVESSVVLWSMEEGSARTWEARTSLDASTPADAHFMLNAQTGRITLGDGQRGRVLPRGATLSATYLKTAAKAGLLNRGETATDGDLTVETVLPATGGADAETLEQGIARAVAEREASLRAVTLTDYETLAKTTPGVDLARVTTRANVHPSFDCVKAFGVVTVIVMPKSLSPTPRPDVTLRERIRRRLNRHRLIGTRVEVTGPTYLQVAVRATVQGFPRQNQARVQDAIVTALNRFFDPLAGGPDGNGWPFGRDVYRIEVLQTIMQTPGVDHVVNMDLLPASCEPQCGNICLKPTWLVASGQHQIEVV